MRETKPEVRLLAKPEIDWVELVGYLESVGGLAWAERKLREKTTEKSPNDSESLIELAGRLCYRSWEPGLNANVTKIREDSAEYLRNILNSGHGSVLEHANFTFLFHNVSRVFTHELVRHRAGAAYCLDGDTEVTIETRGTARGDATLNRVKISDLYERWHNGALDVRGRRRLLPSSRTRTVRVLNEDTQLFETASILDVMQSGVKPLLRIETEDGKVLKCTADHAIYTKRGWVKAGDLFTIDAVAVTGKRNALTELTCRPRLRAEIGAWATAQRTVLIKEMDYCYVCGGLFAFDDLELDHQVPVVVDLAKALDKANLAPICVPCHRVKTGSEQVLSNKRIVAGSKFVAVKSIDALPEAITYDLSVQGPWNNFLANGIVVHNSQESMRFVRLTDIPFWFPEWAQEDVELMTRSHMLLAAMEEHQLWMAEHFGLDGTKACSTCEGDGRIVPITGRRQTPEDGQSVTLPCKKCEGTGQVVVPFHEKKAKTSFMRRFAPDGVSTAIVFTANVRTLRHVLATRTAAGAEEEIRLVFQAVGKILQEEVPSLFGDFEVNQDGEWIPKYLKV